MWPRILSAACHSFCSNPRFAPLALDELERFFAISLLIGVVYYRPTEGAFFSQRTREMGIPFSGELRKAGPSLRSGSQYWWDDKTQLQIPRRFAPRDDKSIKLVRFAELTVGEVAEHDGVGGILHVLLLLGFGGAW